MNILNINLLNLKKLRAQRGKALFLILPIFIPLTITAVSYTHLDVYKRQCLMYAFQTSVSEF